MENKSLSELTLMTKEELISLILGDENQNNTICTKSFDSPNGQISREFVTKDPKGSILSTTVWNWTYAKNGQVDEITHVVLDSKKIPIIADKILHSDGVVEKIDIDLKQIPAVMLSAQETLIETVDEKIIDEKDVESEIETKIP